MALFPVAPSPQVTLRSAQPADAPLLFRWRSEPSVRRYQPLSEASIADLRADLLRQRGEDLYRSQGERFQWIVVVDGQPAGWITLAIASWEHGIAEVGYALSTPFQGRGAMRRALAGLVERLFAKTTLARLEARCATGNRASIRVLESVGFRREGLLRGYFEIGGARVDNWLYALLRSDRCERPAGGDGAQSASRLA
jgi:[ribosomal protein S5]-alanine N-acetyltransferase